MGFVSDQDGVGNVLFSADINQKKALLLFGFCCYVCLFMYSSRMIEGLVNIIGFM